MNNKEERRRPRPKNKRGPIELHERNIHKGRYDLQQLAEAHQPLKPFIAENKYGNESIDFSNPTAVKALNSALLAYHYHIKNWDIPKGFLTPPIPGRADYVHYVADLFGIFMNEQLPIGPALKILDIGTGANAIYPILAHQIYGWRAIGSDIDKEALAAAQKNIEQNGLEKTVSFRLQENKEFIFKDIYGTDERIDAVMCNPPFHGSQEEASKSTLRKTTNLGTKKGLNFGGTANELWYEGGEKAFIEKMIRESKNYAEKTLWFTTLVSKKEHLQQLKKVLKSVEPEMTKTIFMGQGNKTSQILCWSFHDKKTHFKWTSPWKTKKDENPTQEQL